MPLLDPATPPPPLDLEMIRSVARDPDLELNPEWVRELLLTLADELAQWRAHADA